MIKNWNNFSVSSDDDKLKLLIAIEDIDNILRDRSYDLSGESIKYDEKNDTIEYNWYSPEEGGVAKYKITYKGNNQIDVNYNYEAHTVYGDQDAKSMNSYAIDQFILYLKDSYL